MDASPASPYPSDPNASHPSDPAAPRPADPIEQNRLTRDRLDAVVTTFAGRSAADHPSVAPMLAQLAFWDRWAEQLLRRWRSGQLPPPSVPPWYDDAVNAALADQWSALSVRAAGSLAVAAAAAVDREVEHLETPVLVAITAAGELDLVHRHRYREPVLERLERG
jgi:hypothetical protein